MDSLEWLRALQGSAFADGSMRRAALNLMEDAVAAQQTGERDLEARQLAEERLQRAVAATGLALFEWDCVTDTLTANTEFFQLLDAPEETDASGSALFSQRGLLQELLNLRGESQTRREFEWNVSTRPERARWLLFRIHADFGGDAQPQAVAGTAIDITERKRSNDALQQARDVLEERVTERTAELSDANAGLARELHDRGIAERHIKQLAGWLMSAQEDERQAIARDIHDQLGQKMTALRLGLALLRVQGAVPSPSLEHMDRIDLLTAQLDDSIDFITQQLRPPTLDALGLAAALSSFVDVWAESLAIAVVFSAEGCEHLRFAAHVEAHIYRFVQEALHNVQQHAAASQVVVTVACEARHFTVTVADNGQGFDPTSPAHLDGRHFGLVSMSERAALSGGEFTLTSAPGRGATVSIRIPTEAA